jgi:UDP-N-acetylglucosamine 2-epimerase (non-hydrolysing)
MKKVMLVFGTRPEAIKMCPLVKEFQKYPEDFETIVCVTGQHREMLDQVLRIFEVKPDVDLNIMRQGQDLYDVTAQVLTGMREVFKGCRPDVVLVHGDTTTSAAAALAAFYQQIPVGHVEAGLRTRNIYSPWPEEMNRQITGRIATYNFAPTPLSKQNLLEEKCYGQIFVTGNTVIDALHMIVDKLKSNPALAAEQENVLRQAGYDVSRLKPETWNLELGTRNSRKLVLITGHRRENFGEGFISMVTAMKDLSEKYPDVDFVYPMHLNPNVRKPIAQVFGEEYFRQREELKTINSPLTINSKLSTLNFRNVFLIEPLQYLEFVYLMEKSTIVLTDSGGIQEEAPSLGKPVLVMRDITERPEAVEAGTVKLVGTNHDLIVSEVSTLLEDAAAYEKMSKAVNPYGDGKACPRILQALLDFDVRCKKEDVRKLETTLNLEP